MRQLRGGSRSKAHQVRYRLHKRLFFRISELEDRICDKPWVKDWHFSITEGAQKALCLVLSHVPINDQCCIPEHDFCAYCGKSMPGKA